MALDAGNTDKLAVFRQECQQKSITILPPDINKSFASFAVEPVADAPDTPAAVRYALGAIKNVGSEAMSRLVDVRQDGGSFSSLEDLLKRLPGEVINRRQLEGLVRAGAFDSLHPNRRELIENMDLLLSHADAMRREAESNQDNLFGGTDETDSDASGCDQQMTGPPWID